MTMASPAYHKASSDDPEEGGFEVRPSATVGWRACGAGPPAGVGPGAGLWRVCAAEGAGAALLVLLVCLPCAPAPPLQRALAAGAAVALLVQSLDHVSGAQLNPTVTLAAALARHVSPARALAEVCSQLAGAALGAAALRLLSPASLPLCVTRPAPDVSDYRALAIEALAGGCLALVNLAAWDARKRQLRDSWPLRAGAAVAALTLAAGEFTGASMNPARSVGPALVTGDWRGHWVYWAGPLLGSLLAAALYTAAWRPAPHTAPHTAPAAPPRSHDDTMT